MYDEIIHLFSSVLSLSNDTVFDKNSCDQLSALNCEMSYLILKA